jgi:2-succinyl-6-hydroxy-2,4-cyclohexadiene-1-carboxylate synthase
VTVFVHGFTQTERSWLPVIDVPRAESQHEGGVELSILARIPRAATFVETVERIVRFPGTYVGYSQGGRLCLQLALDHADVVQRLVLVSASPGIADDAARATRRTADDQLAREIERDGVDVFLDRWLAQPLFASLPADRARLVERRQANTVDGLTTQLRVLGQGSQPSNWHRLGELAIPVLLIVGALDTKYVAIAREMAAAIRDVRVEVIPDAGHACHLEQPEQVAHLLRSWVEPT